MPYLYDANSKESICDFARMLEDSCVAEALDTNAMYGGMPIGEASIEWDKEYSGKGGFGQYLEEVYFGKRNNSLSKADFEEAGLELKTAPLKKLSNGEVRAKERIVLGLMDFMTIVHENFDTSHFIAKNIDILLVFYFHDPLKEYCNLGIPLVDIWNCIQEDEYQIRKDWEYIVNKVQEGRAHEISEGDTLYLGACTKGATKETAQRMQPYSPLLAHARAFCFKIQYVNHIYQILLDRKKDRFVSYIHMLNSPGNELEQIVKNKFLPYIGMNVLMICTLLKIPFKLKSKNFYAMVTKRILGAEDTQQIYEFEAADIQIKTIRIEPNGKCKESMSFKQIRYEEIIDQEWEDSDFYVELTSKFFFIVFKHDHPEDPYILDRVLFWNMPETDLQVVKQVWLDAQQKISSGNYENFVKSSDRKIAHVRPHATDSSDVMRTPQGTYEKKKSFWLNRNYIMEILNNN
ncbi:Sau3AI family type II restriction endonuclease [Sphaerochaeta globosa]|uniref:Type II site-specific deoxyribonuclease n=1 Tax=Sphaerochaeta globosa (strain ATCC BAA-1886 / DSM 22777 / Buddy) TaxID=158189 RepID=F0RTE3_SPHGB|nr:Sau3AI family type II restriction endonuclease [Sphaerochaeta globosa]ADY14425.1 Type II site-specific deoxyribonuclease [Sphaerochaeta globosa str. Buddy]